MICPHCGKDVEEKTYVDNDPIVVWEKFKIWVNPVSRFTVGGRKKIEKRLETYSVGELELAMANFSDNDWWMKHNGHRPLTWFFHSDDRIETFLNMKPEAKSWNSQIVKA